MGSVIFGRHLGDGNPQQYAADSIAWKADDKGRPHLLPRPRQPNRPLKLRSAPTFDHSSCQASAKPQAGPGGGQRGGHVPSPARPCARACESRPLRGVLVIASCRTIPDRATVEHEFVTEHSGRRRSGWARNRGAAHRNRGAGVLEVALANAAGYSVTRIRWHQENRPSRQARRHPP